jgi:hypothetical protein
MMKRKDEVLPMMKRKEWYQWALVEARTADANMHEATTAAELSNKILYKHGVKRSQMPLYVKKYLRDFKLPPKIGGRKRFDIGRQWLPQKERVGAIWPKLQSIFEELDGVASLRQVQKTFFKTYGAPTKYWEASIRETLNRAVKKGKIVRKKKGYYLLVSHSPSDPILDVTHGQKVQSGASPDTFVQ